jgi:hypothetical protein
MATQTCYIHVYLVLALLVFGCRTPYQMELRTAGKSADHLGILGGLDVSVNGISAPLTQPIKAKLGDSIVVSGNLVAASGTHFKEDHLLRYKDGVATYMPPQEEISAANDDRNTPQAACLIIRTVYYSVDKNGRAGNFTDQFVFRQLQDDGSRAIFGIYDQTVPSTKGLYELRLEISTPLSDRSHNGVVDFGPAIVNKLCDVIVE